MDLIIRNANINDLDGITEVEKCCFPKEEAATRESFNQRINTFPESFFVAELEGKIIGFINGAVTNETTIYDELYTDSTLHIADGKYQTIFGLDVLPTYRKQGIAAILMKYFIAVSRERGKNGLILTCKENLINYYSKFGYENKGLSKSVHGGAQWYDMILNFKI